VSPGQIRFLTLVRRETTRFWKIKRQTLGAPLLETFLYISVFGAALGSRIDKLHGVDYVVFIIPGLIMMAWATNAFSNNSSSLLQARNDRYINDVLASPMQPWRMNLGYMLGGVFRSLTIGVSLGVIALPLTGVPIEQPVHLIVATLLLVVLFSALGVVVGIYAQSFDHHSFINNILILPLTFLGGVFYSIEILPSPWQELSHANPIFYMVDAIRYGFLGASDVNVGLAFGFTGLVAIAMVAWAQWLFQTGRKLKP